VPSLAYKMMRRDRLVVISAMVAITALAWAYLIFMPNGMMHGLAPSTNDNYRYIELTMSFLMWSVMMVAMMLPTASPMVLTYVKMNRSQSKRDKAALETGLFIAGYIVVWSVFSFVFALLQEGLKDVGLISQMMGKANLLFGGLILITVGIYQFTPLKDACLRLCQTPLGFLMTRWKDGTVGAFKMGLEHGIYCVGCCWALMLLMFAGGVMNFLLMALLAVFMLAEKMVPPGHWLPKAFGMGLIVWGGTLLVTNI